MCLRKKDYAVGDNYQEKKHYLYEKGVKKLEKELDIVNLVRSIRQLKLMAQVLLGPSERMLLKFQRKNMIETDTSSEDSDHHKNDTIKLLNSNQALVKLQQLIRINRVLKFFCKGKNLVPGDRNLIKGIFMRTPVAA